MKNLKKLLVAGMLATSMFMMTAPAIVIANPTIMENTASCSHVYMTTGEATAGEWIVGSQDICYYQIDITPVECEKCHMKTTLNVITNTISSHNWNIATEINGVPHGSCRKCGRRTPSN